MSFHQQVLNSIAKLTRTPLKGLGTGNDTAREQHSACQWCQLPKI